MTLPIDPTQISPADVGEEQVRLEMGHEEAIEFVRECCLETGFGIPVEFAHLDTL